MVNQTLVDKFGTQLETSFGQNPSAEGEGHEKFDALAKAAALTAPRPMPANPMMPRR